MRKKLAVLPQYTLPQRGLSQLAGWLAESRCKWLKRCLIRYFLYRFPDVNLQEALSSNPEDYDSFNSFFTRTLKPGLRPIAPTGEIASPADGCISQLGKIKADKLFQAKGFDFTLADLLGGAKNTPLFMDGSFATIYLAPRDYHRVHMPLTGKLRETTYIPGKLFSVNQKTARHVPNLFARNERLVCIFDTEIGPIAVILVGAMLVGSINTTWGSPKPSTKVVSQAYLNNGVVLEKGAELGYFKMGSTAIVLFPKDTIEWNSDLQEASPVMMGAPLGKIC